MNARLSVEEAVTQQVACIPKQHAARVLQMHQVPLQELEKPLSSPSRSVICFLFLSFFVPTAPMPPQYSVLGPLLGSATPGAHSLPEGHPPQSAHNTHPMVYTLRGQSEPSPIRLIGCSLKKSIAAITRRGNPHPWHADGWTWGNHRCGAKEGLLGSWCPTRCQVLPAPFPAAVGPSRKSYSSGKGDSARWPSHPK